MDIFPGKVFQKTWKFLHTQETNHSITEVGGKSNQTEIQGKKFLKISVYLKRLNVCFSKNFRKCYSTCHTQFPEIQKGIGYYVKSYCVQLSGILVCYQTRQAGFS